MSDQEKRKKLVWEIDKKLQEDGARPIIFHDRRGTCWQPQVKGLTMMVNSIYNGWRYGRRLAGSVIPGQPME